MKLFRAVLCASASVACICWSSVACAEGAAADAGVVQTVPDANASPEAVPVQAASKPLKAPVNIKVAQLSGGQTELSQQSPSQAAQFERAAGSPTAPHDEPYPIEAAGWSKPRSFQFFDSRWEEDWSTLQKEGKAPPMKAQPLFGTDQVTLTLSAEDRFRVHFYGAGQLATRNDYTEIQNRTIVGADLHVTDHFRLYTEVGHADLSENGVPEVQSVMARQEAAAMLQQMFAEFREEYKGVLVGTQLGRMEYTDAPEQLISVGNGPNLHATWNGERFYIHTKWFRIGYFEAYPTDDFFGYAFNQTVSHREYIRSVTGSVNLTSIVPQLPHGERYNMFFDPLYIESVNSNASSGPTAGADHRFTYGGRFWGRLDRITYDWMLYGQKGFHIGRPVDAYMASMSQDVKFTPFNLPMTAGFRFDIASGGAYNKTGATHLFDPIYVDKGIFGEAELYSYQNLVLIAPTYTIRPFPKYRLSLEYDFVWKQNRNDAFYTPGKAYAGTQNIKDKYAGAQVRVNQYYDITNNLFFRLESDQMSLGPLLRRAHLSDSYTIMPDITLRY